MITSVNGTTTVSRSMARCRYSYWPDQTIV